MFYATPLWISRPLRISNDTTRFIFISIDNSEASEFFARKKPPFTAACNRGYNKKDGCEAGKWLIVSRKDSEKMTALNLDMFLLATIILLTEPHHT